VLRCCCCCSAAAAAAYCTDAFAIVSVRAPLYEAVELS
jgi:hypothetical protein